jgi:hypothetical protein
VPQQVRTRAVTLQKYICSSEDILKYASKLLKAELPVSLRLIGTIEFAINILLYEKEVQYIFIFSWRGDRAERGP